MLEIHGVPLSVHTRKVLVAANAKGIDYENRPVIPFDPPADWRRISPTGLIPAITDGDFALSDSAAICGYLERLQPAPALYPAAARALGRALWLEQYATGVLFREVVRPLFHEKVIRPHILQEGPADQAAIARVEANVAPAVFGYLEAQVEGAFMVGDDFAIADIAVACNLVNYHYLGLRLDAERYPRLAEAFARTLAAASFRQALQAEAPFVEKMSLDASFLKQAA